MSFVLNSCFAALINVYRKSVSENHEMWELLPTLFKSFWAVECLLSHVLKLTVCSAVCTGLSDQKSRSQLQPLRYVNINSRKPEIVLHHNTL